MRRCAPSVTGRSGQPSQRFAPFGACRPGSGRPFAGTADPPPPSLPLAGEEPACGAALGYFAAASCEAIVHRRERKGRRGRGARGKGRGARRSRQIPLSRPEPQVVTRNDGQTALRNARGDLERASCVSILLCGLGVLCGECCFSSAASSAKTPPRRRVTAADQPTGRRTPRSGGPEQSEGWGEAPQFGGEPQRPPRAMYQSIASRRPSPSVWVGS